MKNIVLKGLIAGDASVGKTTLLHRYVEGEFIDSMTMTIGVDFHTKQLDIDEKREWDIFLIKIFNILYIFFCHLVSEI